VGHHHAHQAGSADARRRLALVLGLTATFMVAEVVGGLLAGSVALLADAGHMLSDSLSLGLALLAAWAAQRPATSQRTFGYRRAEILAALVNGLALVAISLFIFVEAGSRLGDPPEVEGGLMLGVAVAGLVVNAIGATVLARSSHDNLNVSAALRHVLADLLGSVGVIVAAIVVLTTGWEHADPLVGIVIGALVLVSSLPILRDSGRILLEATPKGIDAGDVGRRMRSQPGIVEVHDLHVWTITSGFPALAAHVLVATDDDCHARRRELERMLEHDFGITHTTLQVDHAHGEQPLLQIEPRAARDSD
jgi:cobalt-zinc-cadmium efflux system protein